MKRLLLLASLLLGGCAAFHGKPGAPAAPAPRSAPAAELVDADGGPIERIPFRAGVSSVTVEKMARSQHCTGGQGAGLVTEPGPVEVYRLQCENGKVFMARCELRQCSPM